jgi:hypothetical protein
MAHWHIEPPKRKNSKAQPILATESELNQLSDLDIISAAYHIWDIKHLSPDPGNGQLDKCYLLNWKPAHLLAQLINKSAGTIQHQDVEYSITYARGCKAEDIAIAKKACVSFRVCKRLQLAVAMIKFIY